MVRAIVGGCWGDEGKGKITDMLASGADIVVRFQGGANAGHTIINDYGKFALHLLPSGVFTSGVINVLASGVAFDADEFFGELKILTERGVPEPEVLISSRAQLLLPFHKLQDKLEEKRLGKFGFGSTQSGIAPFYSDKYAKKNIQISELYSPGLQEKVNRIAMEKNIFFKAFYGVENAVESDELLTYLACLGEKLKPLLIDCPRFMNEALKSGKNILIEGQLGSLRDTDNGIYPYVTSSPTLAGFGSVSLGIPPYAITSVVAVVKAYSTCVGAGPFVGELWGDTAEELRRRGGSDGEYGATTGRPRRMGWFDAVAAKYGCMLQGATEVALTLLDVLGYLDSIPVCIGYKVNGQLTRDFPETNLLDGAVPVYEYLDGWRCDISGITSYDSLPTAAKKYIDFIEEQLGVPVRMVSNGPRRSQILLRQSGR